MNIKELIAELKKYDPEMTVGIKDADTGWVLHVNGVSGPEMTRHYVRIYGSYGDELDDNC